MIEIRHFKLVETVSKVGSLTKAAEQLFLTQSALSHQLKELETHLGVQVFYRINNQLHFTPAGKEFLEAGRDILENLEKLELRLQQMSRDQLKSYVHGYSEQETKRLNDQAKSISELLHWDSVWQGEPTILEAGCGVGAQTQIISTKNPNARFISIDLSEKSLKKAAQVVEQSQLNNVELKQANVFNLPFTDNFFDHVFVCFVLEHLSEPERALKELKRVLKPGGTITVIEGDHGSAYFYPDSPAAHKTIQAQVALQKLNGGNANIGRQLYPMLSANGFVNINANPRVVYVDDSKPEMVDGFTRNTFTAMVNGVGEEVVTKNLISKEEFDRGIKDLYRTTQGGGTFCYTFFKIIGHKPW